MEVLRSSPTRPNTFFLRIFRCPPAPCTPTGRGRIRQEVCEKLLLSSRLRSKSISLACVRTTNGNASAGGPSRLSLRELLSTKALPRSDYSLLIENRKIHGVVFRGGDVNSGSRRLDVSADYIEAASNHTTR